MANPDEASIQLLHQRSQGGVARSPVKRMLCPLCTKESEQFAEDDALFEHVATAHPARRVSTWNWSEKQKLIDDAEKAMQEFSRDASSPDSPIRSASRTSGDSRVRQDSVQVEPPGSRSPSIPDEPDPKLHSKRRFQDDSDYPLKQSIRPKLDQSTRQGQRNAPPPGILPEDIDAGFKRIPVVVSERTTRKQLSPRGTFDPGSGGGPNAASIAAYAAAAPMATVALASHVHASQSYSDAFTDLANVKSSSNQPGSRAGLAPSSNSPSTTSRRPAAVIRRPLGLKLRYSAKWPTLILEPESKDISQEQLAAEVKSIYSGLNMVENRCIHLDKAQQNIPRSESNISDEHWQAMIALHRTLLHEHHDFLLASQHPSASPALKRLALKYSMPSRMWKHGMHSFLELLRHRLPESLEYMLAFINLAYQMMTLLYDTIRSFRNTWIECLGDLGRYRMAVEDDDQPERETWAGVARSWYNQAADTNPAIGRFFHHLAILARPDIVQQLYLYHRSLTSIISFTNARESIVTVFEPILSETPPLQVSHSDAALTKVHARLFKKQNLEVVENEIDTYIQSLPFAINQAGDKWRQPGTFTAIANIGCLFDFGSESSPLRFLFDVRRKMLQQQDPKCVPPGVPADQPIPDMESLPQLDSTSEQAFEHAADLLMSTFKVTLSRSNDRNVMPFVHCMGVFLLNLSHVYASTSRATYAGYLLSRVPWGELVSFVNSLAKTQDNIDDDYKTSILFQDERPLPEDWMMRGLSWTFGYFPLSWFKDAATTEEEERYMERTSTVKARADRIMSLAVQLAKVGDRIAFDSNTNRFNVAGQDVPMLDDGDDDMHEDSREMNVLREKLEQHEPDQECVKSLNSSFGKVVPNLDILRQTEVVNIILDKSNMAMIIPHECMTTLLDSANSQELSSNESAAALHNLRNALNGFKNITIQDTKGEDLTRYYVGSQAVAFLDQATRQHRHQFSTTPLKEDEDVIHALDAVARQNSDLEKNMSRASTQVFSRTATDMTDVTDPADYDDDMGPGAFPASFSPPDDRPAIVITDDRKVRAEVGKLGSAAIAGWMIKKLLMTKKGLSGQGDPTSRMNVDQPMRRTPAT